MKMIVLIILAVIFLYYLFKSMIQSWPIGWPFKKVSSLDRHDAIMNTDLQARFGKEAIKSLVVCCAIVFIVQFLISP